MTKQDLEKVIMDIDKCYDMYKKAEIKFVRDEYDLYVRRIIRFCNTPKEVKEVLYKYWRRLIKPKKYIER